MAFYDDRDFNPNDPIDQKRRETQARMRRENKDWASRVAATKAFMGGDKQTGDRLRDKERAATGASHQGDASTGGGNNKKTGVTPQDLRKAESSPRNKPGGLYKRDMLPEGRLGAKMKTISRRQKIFAGVGIGGLLGIILSLITVAPAYRLPSMMGAINSLAGEAIEELLEHRGTRFIIRYAIHRAGVQAVAGNSLAGTLWSTWRANRVELKMLRDTGFEFRRVGNEVRVFYFEEGNRGDNRDRSKAIDMGRAQTYDEFKSVIEHIDKTHPQIAGKVSSSMRKLLRIYSGQRFLRSSGFRLALKNRFQISFKVPTHDKHSTNAQNEINIREAIYEAPSKVMAEVGGEVIECLAEGACDFMSKPDKVSNPSPKAKDGIRSMGNNIAEAQAEVSEAIKEGAHFGKAEVKVAAKLASKFLTKLIPFYDIISGAAAINHFINTVDDKDLLVRLPAYATSSITGAQAAQYLGLSDAIKAGLLPLGEVRVINSILEGEGDEPDAYNSEANCLIDGRDRSKCVAVEAKVNDNMRDPLDSTLYEINNTYNPFRRIQNIILEAVYYGEDAILDFLLTPTPLGAWLIDKIPDAIDVVCNQECQTNVKNTIGEWAMSLIIPVFGLNVDLTATGSRLVNQLFVGIVYLDNWFMKEALGGKALTDLVPYELPPYMPSIFSKFLSVNSRGSTPSLNATFAARERMKDLPLGERLFSLDEPYSLLNQSIRSMPGNQNPLGLIAAIFRQVGIMPAQLISIFSSRTQAAEITRDQIAEVTGVRQWGYTAEDLDQDLSSQIFEETDPACWTAVFSTQESWNETCPQCPDIDQETSVNICKADIEIGKALLCEYSDCPAYLGYEPPDTTRGFLANVRRALIPDQALAIWGLR